ncbi:MAG: FUSC family protein [Micromonosporaceae bacterium]
MPAPGWATFSARLQRLRTAGLSLVRTALAVGLSWFLVRDVLGHDPGIFAPIGALYVLSQAPGRPSRRVFEAAVGAALGVAVGDLLIAAIGTGPIQVALVAGLAMVTTIALGANPQVVSQATIAAVLIATVQPPEGVISGLASERLLDILIGCGVGLAASLVLPAHPLRTTKAVAEPFFVEMVATLEQTADALAAHDREAAERALLRARTLDRYAGDLQSALDLALETTRLSPVHLRKRDAVGRRARAADHLEFAARDVRVLARATLRATEVEPDTPAALAVAVRDLAEAVRQLRNAMRTSGAADEAIRYALRAAGRATRITRVSAGASMPVSAIVAQIRSTATDLLRALGYDRSEAVDRVRRAADALDDG